MDFVCCIIWIILSVTGIAGSILPWLPWPQLWYVAILLAQFLMDKPFSWWFVIIWWFLVIVLMLADYYLPILWTKKFWWTKWWNWWCIIGMVLGIMPVVGIPLIFVSSGGSALISNMMSLGILENIYSQRERKFY